MQTPFKNSSYLQGLSDSQLSDPEEIVEAFKRAEKMELVMIKAIRVKNFRTRTRLGGMSGPLCQLCRCKDL